MLGMREEQTDQMDEEGDVSANNFDTLLEEDSTFVEFFNTFLALPMFPIRLHYNPVTGHFEEFKQKLADDVMESNAKRAASLKRYSHFKSTIDSQGVKIGYYIKFLEKDEGILWVKKNRLSLFLRSEICAEYKLARSLSNAQTQYLVNILVDSINLQKAAFNDPTAPKYRINRNRGALPGLAEFQKQIKCEAGEDSADNSSSVEDSHYGSDSDVSDTEALEFSVIETQGEISSTEKETEPLHTLELESGSSKVSDVALQKVEEGQCEGSVNVDFLPSVKSFEEKVPETDGNGRVAKDEGVSKENLSTDCIDVDSEKSSNDDNIQNVSHTPEVAEHISSDGVEGSGHELNRVKVSGILKENFEDVETQLTDGSKVAENNPEENTEGHSASKGEEDALDAVKPTERGTMEIDGGRAGASNEAVEDMENDEVGEMSLNQKEKHGGGRKECWAIKFSVKTNISDSGNRSLLDVKGGIDRVDRKAALHKRYSLPHDDKLSLSELIEDIPSYLPIRRLSLPVSGLACVRRQSGGSVDSSALQEITKILVAKNAIELKHRETLQSLYEETDSDEDFESVKGYKAPRRPLDIASKIGMDSFKMFLIDTTGEKLFLLWIDIERMKACENKDERTSMVQEIRRRFFRSGATYELPARTLGKGKVLNTSEINYESLVGIQKEVEEPLKHYWCARFTFHQKLSHRSKTDDYLSSDHQCTKTRCSTHQRELTRVPQRPNTCFATLRARKKLEACSLEKTEAERMVANQHEGGRESRTRANVRSKSAHPRLINTSNIKEVNLSYKQLQEITVIDEGCGFKALPYCRYKNNASSHGEEANVRLFIQPLPPSNCTASTVERTSTGISRSDNVTENELMDSLVECLLHEKHSGNFFYQHLQQRDDQHALDCYHFWRSLQDYSENFFSESFNPSLIKQKAGYIFSAFIASGAQSSIKCPRSIQDDVHRALDPPYEDLFDKAEEHALQILLLDYRQLYFEENNKYKEVKKSEKMRYLDVQSRLRRPKHRPNEVVESDDDDEEDYREKVTIEEMNSPLPAAADGVTFESFIRNKQDFETFKEFLERRNNKGLRDLLAWTEMENFRRSPRRNDQRNTLAKSVRSNWLTIDYFFGWNSPAAREAQAQVRRLGGGSEIPERPPSPQIIEAQKYVRARIERRWFLMFKDTQSYQKKLIDSNVTEMVEDIIMKRRLQRSEAAWKVLNSRWVSGSRDVVALRLVLMDPDKCNGFRKFLSLKGELMDRNVYFWLEVQKYKDLCHRHVEISMIKAKIQAIIDVFIKSAVPPELQIDVPIEIAERLHDKATGRVPQHGPYLFREAQTTVFRIMFNHWKDFLSFRASMEDAKLTQHLEEMHVKHRAQAKAKRMAFERRRLAKVAQEKRRKEKEEAEKPKDRTRNGLLSNFTVDKAFSLISEDEDPICHTKTFAYSKFTIEQQLQTIEQRMRDEGYTVEDYTEGDLTQSYVNNEKKSFKKSWGVEDQKSVSGASVKNQRRKGESAVTGHRKSSVLQETLTGSVEGSQRRDTVGKKEGSRTNPGKLTKLYDGISKGESSATKRGSRHKKTKWKDFSKGSRDIDESSSTIERRKSIMPGPQRTGTFLTIQSLQEFEKSPQGKPLASPLPLIRITSMDENISKKVTKTKDKMPRKPHPRIQNQKRLASSKMERHHGKPVLDKVIVS